MLKVLGVVLSLIVISCTSSPKKDNIDWARLCLPERYRAIGEPCVPPRDTVNKGYNSMEDLPDRDEEYDAREEYINELAMELSERAKISYREALEHLDDGDTYEEFPDV